MNLIMPPRLVILVLNFSHLGIDFESYKMVDGVDIGKQIHTFEDHVSVIEKYGIAYNGSHIISILLNKLPPFGIGFTNALRHKIDSLDLMGVYNNIGTEEGNRLFFKGIDFHKGRACWIEYI